MNDISEAQKSLSSSFCTQGSSCHNLRVTCSAGAELPSHTVGSILMYASLAVVLRMALGSVEIVVEFQYMGIPYIPKVF